MKWECIRQRVGHADWSSLGFNHHPSNSRMTCAIILCHKKVNQLESSYKFKVYKLVKLVGRLEQNTLKPYSLTGTLEHFLTAYPAHVSKLSSGHFWGIVHAVHLLVNQGECHSRSLALRSFNWLESPGKISWPWGQKISNEQAHFTAG